MKAAINGVINLSILDGWWGEGYDGKNGWAIKPASDTLDEGLRDAEEARTLYELLQDQVIPLYYSVGPMGYSPGWIAKAKLSIATLMPRYSSMRMLSDYIRLFYAPAARQWRHFSEQEFRYARELAAWKAKVRSSWGGLKLRRVDVPVTHMAYGQRVLISVAIALNGLDPADVTVEMLIAKTYLRDTLGENLDGILLHYERPIPETNEHLYLIDMKPELSGRVEYRIRAYPFCGLLAHRFEMGMMTWLEGSP
jgi:starch phosphorylase